MSKEIIDRVLLDCLGVTPDQLVPTATLAKDLDADSLDVVEIVMELEDKLNIDIDDADYADTDQFSTVQHIYDLVASKVSA